MKPLLAIENVSMQFSLGKGFHRRRHQVFEGIDFSLQAGETVGIIGRNGSGKSTLLRIMARIFAPSSGRVVWSPGVSVSLLSLGLGFRADLSGRENAFMSCLLQGLSLAEVEESLFDIEAFCELGQFFYEPVNTYSAGMRARLGFATALMNRSRVVLIDEVLSVGDKIFRDKARQALLKELSGDRSVVLVSHIDEQVKKLCQRAVLLNDGAIVSEGSPAGVLSDYAAIRA